MPSEDNLFSKWDSENSSSVVSSQFLRVPPAVDCEEIKMNGEALSNQVVETLQ